MVKRKYDKNEVVCLYNDAIDCNFRDMTDTFYCRRCGWNPAEQAKRKMQMYTDLMNGDNGFKFEIKK